MKDQTILAIGAVMLFSSPVFFVAAPSMDGLAFIAGMFLFFIGLFLVVGARLSK